MGLPRRWLAHSLTLGLGLLFAGLAMQAPALTHDYMAALLQVERELQQDVDQRVATARRVYSFAAADADGVAAALADLEPANAESLARSNARVRRLGAAWRTLDATTPVARPIVALAEEGLDRAEIRRTLLETFEPRISLTVDAGLYALLGLLTGALMARLLLALARGVTRLALGGSPRHRFRP
jgi:hypothetical protein